MLYTIYKSVVLSRLNYAITARGNETANKLKRLVLLRKKAIHVVTNSSYNSQTGPIFNKCNTLPRSANSNMNAVRSAIEI